MDKDSVNKGVTPEGSSNTRMVKGAAWMTAGSMVSRILGALYIIPWYEWMGGRGPGDAASALYQLGYTPYGFFLALATAGVPTAISKQVSYYNALGEYEISKGIYRQGLKIMIFTGFLSASIMYFIAPVLAQSSPSANANEAVIVMRSLTPALLIIPAQSVTRGFIQGHNKMSPSALSQIIEQVTRIIFLLSVVYIITQVMNGKAVTAVAFSTFAAFIGAIFSLGYLAFRLKHLKTALNYLPEESAGKITVSPNQLIINIIKTSIPFIIIATGIIVFQLVDQLTYRPLMLYFSDMSLQRIEVTYGITQANAHKLIMILTSLGTALATASVPLFSDLIAKKNMNEINEHFSKAVELLLFAMIPAAIGMAFVSEPLYAIFYGVSDLGTRVTQVSAAMSIFIALYVVLGNILQAANLTRPAIKALLAGLAVKILTQIPLVAWFGPFGLLLSAMAGFSVSCGMMMTAMHKRIHFEVRGLLRQVFWILVLSSAMGACIGLTKYGLDFVIDYQSRLQSLLSLGILALIGMIIYAYLVLKTRLADQVIGTKAELIRQKFRMN